MALNLSASVQYSTEGAPMLIGDPASARHWNGPKDDGSGVIVEYGGRGVDKLPKEFAQTKKPTGKRQKKFASVEEAAAFESALLKEFLRLHPKAAKHAQYPGHPMYYVEDVGVFGIERKFTSALASLLKKLKGDVTAVTFDKKNKAQALFFEMEGAGRGILAFDPTASTLVITKVLTANKENDRALIESLEETSLNGIKPLGKLKVGDGIVAFDAAYAASDLARHNPGWTEFDTSVAKALKSAAHGPIRVPDQQAPGGAFFRMQPGIYNYGVSRNQRADGTTYNALWLWAA